MLSNLLVLCHPLLLTPSIFPSIRVFSNESAFHIRRPKYWSFSSSSNPSNEYSGLISFRIDWFDLLAVQGTLKNLLCHYRSHGSQAYLLCMGRCKHLHSLNSFLSCTSQLSGPKSCFLIVHIVSVCRVCVLVTQLCPVLCDSMNCSPPGSFIHGILQARILEWVAIPFCRGCLP